MTAEATLALARIIADRDREIAALKRTLASTAQVAIDAESKNGQAALDEAWRRINELWAVSAPLRGRVNALQDALEIIEVLGGMDPVKREADAVSAEHIHKKWSKSL